jgi:hypothetical protein
LNLRLHFAEARWREFLGQLARHFRLDFVQGRPHFVFLLLLLLLQLTQRGDSALGDLVGVLDLILQYLVRDVLFLLEHLLLVRLGEAQAASFYLLHEGRG